MNRLISFSALIIAVVAGGIAIKNRPPKLGYVETSVLLSQFTEAIKARKKYEEAKKQWEANIKTINDSLMVAMNDMKQGYDKAKEKEQLKMRRRLERWNNDLNRYKAAVEKQAKEKDKELMTPVINQVNSFLKMWGDQNGYSLILGTMAGGNILQADAAYNLTAAILKELNEHYKDLPKAEKETARPSIDNSQAKKDTAEKKQTKNGNVKN